MMTDPIHSSNPLPADEKRLSRVRGAHKGAFTKLEKKVDDFLTTVIATPNQLVEAEAFLKTLRLEQTLHRDESLLKKYSCFIPEFLDLGHLEKVESLELDVYPNYYLPHHCVLKEDSSTTKLRVVFDASSKTTTGVFLNECLLVGPKVQEDLFDILLRFRFFKVAMSADTAKMYRQVELSKKDKDYHRIFWRFDRQQPIDTYRMTRVAYGVASSSFHAIRSLVECANREGVSFEAQISIKRDFYVDDILTEANSVDEAKKLQNDLIQALKQAKFDLRKWTCSEASLVLSLPPSIEKPTTT